MSNSAAKIKQPRRLCSGARPSASSRGQSGARVALSLALALLPGACKHTRVSSDAGARGARGSDPKSASQSALQTYWIRNSPLLDASAKPVGAIAGPQLVQIDANSRARSLPGAEPSIDGYLPASLLSAATDGKGLALYAQRQAELHQESSQGPVIGRVYPGAFVSVAPAGPGYLRIALPAFRSASAGSEELVAIVEAAAFGTAPQPLQGPSPEGRLVRDFMINAPLWAAEFEPDLTPPFVDTLCGDVRVLSIGTQRSKISQYHAGVEISGWYDFQIDVDNYCPLHRCKQRFVIQHGQALMLTGTGTTLADRIQIESPPEGFVHAELSDKDALAERIKRGLPVYWLTQTKAHTARCAKWTFDGVFASKVGPGKSKLEGRMRSDPINIAGAQTIPSFALTYEPGTRQQGGTLMLVGLNFNRPGTPAGAVGDPNSYRAMTPYTFVGTTENALRMLDGEWASIKDLTAWHPDDEERWFLSREACTAAADAASSALSNNAETPPGGFHMDCFTELHE